MIIKTDLGNGYVEIKSDKNVYIHGGFPEADYAVVIEPKTVDRKYVETDRPIPKPEPEPEPPQPEPPKPVTNEELKDLVLAEMQGTADLYLAEQENKQLQLDTMQGIADLYVLQMGGGQ